MDACKTTVEAQGILLTLTEDDAQALVAWVEATETDEEEDFLVLELAETLETALAEEEGADEEEDGKDDS